LLGQGRGTRTTEAKAVWIFLAAARTNEHGAKRTTW
jgi:hypothetical protein